MTELHAFLKQSRFVAQLARNYSPPNRLVYQKVASEGGTHTIYSPFVDGHPINMSFTIENMADGTQCVYIRTTNWKREDEIYGRFDIDTGREIYAKMKGAGFIKSDPREQEEAA